MNPLKNSFMEMNGAEEMTTPLPPAGPFNPLRYALDNAMASARLEGLEPTQEFLEDCKQLAAGALTTEELIARAAARAISLENQRSSNDQHD
jgi:hypothetical protein